MKELEPEDRVLVVGNSRCPYEADVKELLKVFPCMVYCAQAPPTTGGGAERCRMKWEVWALLSAWGSASVVWGTVSSNCWGPSCCLGRSGPGAVHPDYASRMLLWQTLIQRRGCGSLRPDWKQC